MGWHAANITRMKCNFAIYPVKRTATQEVRQAPPTAPDPPARASSASRGLPRTLFRPSPSRPSSAGRASEPRQLHQCRLDQLQPGQDHRPDQLGDQQEQQRAHRVSLAEQEESEKLDREQHQRRQKKASTQPSGGSERTAALDCAPRHAAWPAGPLPGHRLPAPFLEQQHRHQEGGGDSAQEFGKKAHGRCIVIAGRCGLRLQVEFENFLQARSSDRGSTHYNVD